MLFNSPYLIILKYHKDTVRVGHKEFFDVSIFIKPRINSTHVLSAYCVPVAQENEQKEKMTKQSLASGACDSIWNVATNPKAMHSISVWA